MLAPSLDQTAGKWQMVKIKLSLGVYQKKNPKKPKQQQQKKSSKLRALVLLWEIVTWKMNREMMTLEKETEGGD